MATLSFKFSHPMALRIANLVTSDINKLEMAMSGRAKPTDIKAFAKPFKANYAQHMVQTYGDRMNEMEAHLPALEASSHAIIEAGKGKAGKPHTAYIQDGDFNNTGNHQTMEQASAARDDIQEIVSSMVTDSVPLPNPRRVQRAQPAATHSAAQVTPTDNGEANAQPEVKDALANLMAALAASNKPAIDPAQVEAIARAVCGQELAKIGAVPTVVHIARTDSEGNTSTENAGIQHKQFPVLLSLLQVRDHNGYAFPVWLPGPAGSGKTTAAMNAAKVMGLDFHHTGAVDTDYKLTGFRDAGGTVHRTPFREAYEHGGVFLFDEVDASNPQAMVALNAALENGHCVFPDGDVVRHENCIVIAAANTFGSGATHEYVGRNKLDAATVDRFIMLEWGYDEALERALASNDAWVNYVHKVRKAVQGAGIKHVVSPRASIRGAALIRAGFTQDFAIAATIRKGMSDDQWRTVTNRM